jgi:hypothetical protein
MERKIQGENSCRFWIGKGIQDLKALRTLRERKVDDLDVQGAESPDHGRMYMGDYQPLGPEGEDAHSLGPKYENPISIRTLRRERWKGAERKIKLSGIPAAVLPGYPGPAGPLNPTVGLPLPGSTPPCGEKGPRSPLRSKDGRKAGVPCKTHPEPLP